MKRYIILELDDTDQPDNWVIVCQSDYTDELDAYLTAHPNGVYLVCHVFDNYLESIHARTH